MLPLSAIDDWDEDDGSLARIPAHGDEAAMYGAPGFVADDRSQRERTIWAAMDSERTGLGWGASRAGS